MKYIMKNLTRRPVSVLCNSGKSYHLPPKYAYEIAAIEFEDNIFIKKLLSRKVVSIDVVAESKPSSKRSTKSVSATAKKPVLAKKNK